MTGTDYTIRTVTATPSGHNRYTVVDRKGRIAHVTVDRMAAINGQADALIRLRLAHLDKHAKRRP